MIRVKHQFNNESIQTKKASDKFILTNHNGSYLYQGNSITSRFQGFFYFSYPKMYKVIEDLRITDHNKPDLIINKFYLIERYRKGLHEEFYIPQYCNSLIYDLSEKRYIDLVLDVRESYDSRTWGRYYTIKKEKNFIIIRYTKKTDSREDPNHDKTEFKLYLVIKYDNNKYNVKDKWFQQEYEADKIRNSHPFSRYVYNAIELEGSKFIFTVSENKKKAIKECKYIYKNSNKLKKNQAENFNSMIIKDKILNNIKDKEIKFSYIAAKSSLDQLSIIDNKYYRMLAGLPWFFQAWSRDELISLKAFMINRSNQDKKNLNNILSLLQDYLSKYRLEDIKSYQDQDLIAADSIGWLLKRIDDFSKLTKKRKKFPKKELLEIINNLVTKRTLNNWAITYSKETWMDSLNRQGPLIEIQAQRCYIYNFMYKITGQKIYSDLEQKLKKIIKKEFFINKTLKDNIIDESIRPNIFIAYYFYPTLLSKKQWQLCCKNTLDKLWLGWGGLSTINKENSLFQPNHTGEINTSYHNGDSWYWINNLAALILHQNNKKIFNRFIKKITGASSKEILWMGAIGHHAELSSASKIESSGCLMQAWSNAMFIELIREIYK